MQPKLQQVPERRSFDNVSCLDEREGRCLLRFRSRCFTIAFLQGDWGALSTADNNAGLETSTKASKTSCTPSVVKKWWCIWRPWLARSMMDGCGLD
eukprot:2450955-Pleurochrysis_carterae.AAC.1